MKKKRDLENKIIVFITVLAVLFFCIAMIYTEITGNAIVIIP